MISLKINDHNYVLKPEVSVLEACKYIGILIPRFCYHETLSIAGNCRMCLVELDGIEKPVASCLTEISEGMSIYTDSIFVKKARENVVETLLLNHPLDCPICDQAGECDLQDQAKTFGSDYSKFYKNKRSVEDKDCGPLIKTIMTRCIHCTRCVRFGSEVAGLDFLGTLNRGTSTEIGSYVSKFFNSEISGNVIDLCPVGALTSKPFGFKARPWELRVIETVDITDSTGSNIYVNFKESEIFRILPKSNENINEYIISDKTRFSYDSNNFNRILNLFHYDNTDSIFKISDWTSFLNQTDSIVKENGSKFAVTISDDIGLKNIEYLKRVSRVNKDVEINSLGNKTTPNNFYFYRLTDKITSIEKCNSAGFIFALNPKLECAVINTRLRTKYQNSLLFLTSLGQSYLYNIPTKFVNLNLSKSLNILEAKYLASSISLVRSEFPLILTSDSFGARGLDVIEIVRFLKSYFNTLIAIKVNESSNHESFRYGNFKNICKKNISNMNEFMCINLDDTFNLRKYFYNIKDKIVWLNSHGSNFARKVKTIIPMLSEYEDTKVFLNLEGRPQKTNKIFNTGFLGKPLLLILESIFYNNIISLKTTHFKFIYETIAKPFLFDETKSIYNFLSYSSCKGYLISFLLKYPIKANIEDFYCSTKSTKNSKTMQKSSQHLRNMSNNFSSIQDTLLQN